MVCASILVLIRFFLTLNIFDKLIYKDWERLKRPFVVPKPFSVHYRFKESVSITEILHLYLSFLKLKLRKSLILGCPQISNKGEPSYGDSLGVPKELFLIFRAFLSLPVLAVGQEVKGNCRNRT